MHHLDPDPAFAAEVDTYISDESDSANPMSPCPTTHQTPQSPSDTLSNNQSPTPNDSIHLHRQRLNRFHKGAKSFLSNVEANASAIVVHDHAASNSNSPSSVDPDNQRVQLDTLRLARFHEQAVSFLDRAYADEPTTLVTEEALSPAGLAAAHSRIQDRELLQSFHHEAMNFLNAAASATSLSKSPLPKALSQQKSSKMGPGFESAEISVGRSADRTSVRIERDKARLEQHYQDAMSFLNRAEDGGGLVEEQELEIAAVERLQLQKYAREAMSFLDKAFRGDASVMVDDGCDIGPVSQSGSDQQKGDPHAEQGPGDIKNAVNNKDPIEEIANDAMGVDHLDDADQQAHQDHVTLDLTKRLCDSGKHAASSAPASPRTNVKKKSKLPKSRIPRKIAHRSPRLRHNEEDRQIAEDRAALERYDEEFGDFLTKAYDNESTIMVEDVDSETSGTDRGRLYARRVIQSSPSAGSSYSRDVSPEVLSDDVYTDDEFQDLTDNKMERAVDTQMSQSSSKQKGPLSLNTDREATTDDNENLRQRMARYEREAADYLDGANVSEEEETEDFIVAKHFKHNSHGSGEISKSVDTTKLDSDNSLVDSEIENSILPKVAGFRHSGGAKRRRSGYKGDKNSESQNDQSEPVLGEDVADVEKKIVARDIDGVSLSERKKQWDHLAGYKVSGVTRNMSPPGRIEGMEVFDCGNKDSDMRMGLRLEDRSGKSGDWCDVRLETSFYRQIPRGATIKLRARASDEHEWRGRDGLARIADGRMISVSALQRVEKERDVLMATLEEIVNERSMLAAQVSEMKSIFPTGKGGERQRRRGSGSGGGSSSGMEDIDLAGELQEAHSIMAKLTEEMEETLSILDNRYQESLDRAHQAEERCNRLESNAYRRETELASQGRRLSQALAEERRLREVVAQTEEEFRALRSKSEKDIQRIEMEYRDESERRGARIQELNVEVAQLQERLEHEKRESRSASPTVLNRLESEVVSLKRKLEQSESALEDERALAKAKAANEEEKRMKEKAEEIRKAERQIQEAAERGATVESEKAKKEMRKMKNENVKLVEQIGDMERQRAMLEREIDEAHRAQKIAEAEVTQVQNRFEESLKERISSLDQTAELVELQMALTMLKDGATKREELLEKQLDEFRGRAKQAEAAAAAAEQGAREAAEIAKLAQDRSRAAVETERAARQAAESELEVLAADWEKLSKMQKEQLSANSSTSGTTNLSSSSSTDGLGKSSSRRGLRKSSSRNKDAERKKKEAKSGTAASDDGAQRKRSAYRPKLFG